MTVAPVTCAPTRRTSGTGRGLGIVTSGKAHLDVVDGLARIGLSLERAGELGISIYKVAMPYPLEPVGVLEFVEGLDEVLLRFEVVVEGALRNADGNDDLVHRSGVVALMGEEPLGHIEGVRLLGYFLARSPTPIVTAVTCVDDHRPHR